MRIDVIDSVVIGIFVACASWLALVLLTLAARRLRRPVEVSAPEPAGPVVATFVAENYIPRGALVQVDVDQDGPHVRWKVEAPSQVGSPK